MSALARNWGLKVAALVLAAALWLFVMTSEKVDMIVTAPVELDAVPTGLELLGERPDSVDVQLHGLRTTLARLPRDQIRARVSLAGSRPGEATVRITPEQVMVPPGVTVLRVNPSRFRVVLEPGRSAKATVVARLRGTLAEGYRVTRVRIIPPEVIIEGPASRVDRIQRVETEPVDVSGAKGTIEREAALGGLADSIRVSGPRAVRVVVEVTRDGAGAGAPGGVSARKGGT
ncbi:MAG TPA: CdaR family protein [Candidatus Limnocylindrales bacterium]|nr:CdaR family protein [Candidatus Limnocylindrales bacterium]